MKNFIEVGKTEDEQTEQIKKWIKENVPHIIIGVSLGLGGIWGFNYYQSWQYQQAIQARGHYLSVVNNPSNIKELEILKSQYSDSNYTQQADLIMVKQAVGKGDYQGALDYLLPLMKSNDTFIAQNAKFKSASVYLEMNNIDKALSTLGDNSNSAFAASYNQLKGDIYVVKRDFDAAKKHYQLAFSQLADDSKLKNLIQIKLDDLN
jgi:predicted negative regulator of RcsB-dependent stress response